MGEFATRCVRINMKFLFMCLVALVVLGSCEGDFAETDVGQDAQQGSNAPKEALANYCEVKTSNYHLRGKCRAHKRFCKLYKGFGMFAQAKKHCTKMRLAHKKLAKTAKRHHERRMKKQRAEQVTSFEEIYEPETPKAEAKASAHDFGKVQFLDVSSSGHSPYSAWAHDDGAEVLKQKFPKVYNKLDRACSKTCNAAAAKCSVEDCKARGKGDVPCLSRYHGAQRKVIPLSTKSHIWHDHSLSDKDSPLFYVTKESTKKEKKKKEQVSKELLAKQRRAKEEIYKERKKKGKQAKEQVTKEKPRKQKILKEKKKKEQAEKKLAGKVKEDQK